MLNTMRLLPLVFIFAVPAFAQQTPMDHAWEILNGGLQDSNPAKRVQDVAATAARIVELGGAVVESSRTILDFDGTALEFVYCTDPDGVRVELMDLSG